MGLLQDLAYRFVTFALGDEINPARRAQLDRYTDLRNYFAGRQRRQLVKRANQADDNITLNFISTIVERSVSLLFGKPIKFDLPGDDDTPQADYIDTVWRANKQGILLHRLAQLGGIYGTCYVKILPGAIRQGGAEYPRLVPVHPAWIEIVPDPEDADTVDAYVILYQFKRDGKELLRKEVHQRIRATAVDESGRIYQVDETAHWTISRYLMDSGGRWVEDGPPVDWLYTFPAIHHWQNLPNAEGCYGKSDIEDVIEPQDRFNFIESNISKIIRYHAHPKTWGRGISGTGNASWGADEMILANGENASIQNLEMQSELASSRAFALDIRQALFDISHTVDLTSIADRVGSLTNFGLRVLFMDALNKNDTKRLLYGDGLVELNRRLLVLAEQASDEQADGGTIVWPDPLPVNEIEQAQALGNDIDNQLVSRQTAAGKRGYNWTEEQERMQGEQESSDSVGAAILRAFSQGRGE